MGFDEGDVDPFPGLFLVKDHGVYLMSNSKTPKDQGEACHFHPARRLKKIVFAKGHDPYNDANWFKRGQVVSQDDFSELFPLFVFKQGVAGFLDRLLRRKKKEVWLALSDHGINVVVGDPMPSGEDN